MSHRPAMDPDSPQYANDDPTWNEPPDDDDYDCLICGGDGYVWGEDLGDPLWYGEGELYTCKSCGGSGLRKDMTFW